MTLVARVGRALHASAASFEVHVAAQTWTGRVDQYADLPGWLRTEVERGEKLLRSRR